MEIIRGRLSSKDFSNPSLRYNSTTDMVQYSPNGGTTWVNSPENDPRHSNMFRLPALTTSDPKCDAAAGMVKWIKDFIDSVIAGLNADATALAVTNDFLSRLTLLFPPALLLLLLEELAVSLFDTGATALDAAFTTEQYDLLKCAFDCHIHADGTVTPADLTNIEVAIASTMESVPAAIVDEILFIQGEVGLSNAGVVEAQTGDCTDCACEWCYEWDFTASDGGWVARTGFGETVGHYVAGVGWQPNIYNDGCSNHGYTYLFLDLGLTADNISFVEYTFAGAIGGFDILFFDQNNSGHGIIQRTGLDNGVDTVHTANMTPVSCQIIEITVNSCGVPAGWTQTKCRVKGLGDMPAFSGGSVCT